MLCTTISLICPADYYEEQPAPIAVAMHAKIGPDVLSRISDSQSDSEAGFEQHPSKNATWVTQLLTACKQKLSLRHKFPYDLNHTLPNKKPSWELLK